MTLAGSFTQSGGLAIQAANGTFTGLTVTGNTHLGDSGSDKVAFSQAPYFYNRNCAPTPGRSNKDGS